MKTQSGFAPIIVLIVLVGLVIFASFGSYYLINSYGTKVGQKYNEVFKSASAPEANGKKGSSEGVSESAKVSQSDEVEVIDNEINDTDIESIDSDLKDIEASTNSM